MSIISLGRTDILTPTGRLINVGVWTLDLIRAPVSNFTSQYFPSNLKTFFILD